MGRSTNRRSALKAFGLLAGAAGGPAGFAAVGPLQEQGSVPERILARPRDSGAPGHEIVLGRSDEMYPRHSEGDLAVLPDGRLLAVWTRFRGSSDFATAELVGRTSEDRGRSWGALFSVASLSEPFHRQNTNLMSASLWPLPGSGRLLMVYLGKGATNPDAPTAERRLRCSVYGRYTADGRNFGEPFAISDLGHYFVVNNARVIQLSKGRLLVPCAVDLRPGHEFEWGLQSCLTYFSDDEGKTWRQGKACSLRPERFPSVESGRLTLQEPGLIELRDGRVLMIIRTRLGHPYHCFSEDGGESWSEPGPIVPIVAPASPQTLFRLPGSDRIIMVYNNSPKGAEAAWSDRRPLAFATSRDEGRTFEFRKTVEEKEGRAWSYPSCRPFEDQVLLGYYEWMQGSANFFFTDFKLSLIPRAWFES